MFLRSFGAGYALHFNLLATDLVPHSLHVIRSLLSNNHFLCDAGILADHRLLGSDTHRFAHFQ